LKVRETTSRRPRSKRAPPAASATRGLG
jgi:hypothetical protein